MTAAPSLVPTTPHPVTPTLRNVTKCDSSTVPARVSAITDPIAETCARVTNGDLHSNTTYKAGDSNDLSDATSPQALAAMEQLPEHLSPRQAQAMDYLLAGFSIAEVASRLGLSRQTIYRWRYNHPTFMSIYGRLTREMSEQAGRRAEQLVYQALDIVQESLTAKKRSPAQLNAAIRVLAALRVSRFTFAPSTPTTYREALDHIMRQHYQAETGQAPKQFDDYDRSDFAAKLASDNETQLPGGQPVLPRITVDALAADSTPLPDYTPPQPPLPVYSPLRRQQTAQAPATESPNRFAIPAPQPEALAPPAPPDLKGAPAQEE